MSRNIFAELKKFKGSQQAGAFSASKQEVTKQVVLEAIGHEEHAAVQTSLRTTGFAAFLRWMAVDLISAPLATTAAIFVFVLGGWLTSVNAASSSVPGDTLYGLKLVTERARLQLASLEDRAVLHTEFAQRRLAEGEIEAYKKEISQAQADLQELSSSGSEQTAEVAATIDEHMERLTSAVETSSADVKDLTDAASQAVVDVLVDAHGAAPMTEAGAIDIEKLFSDELQQIEKYQTFDLGRVAKIRSAIAAHDEIDAASIPAEKDLIAFEGEIVAVTTSLPEVRDLLAAGGSRQAFDALAAMRTALKEIEARLAEQEILVAQAISAAVTTPSTDPVIQP